MNNTKILIIFISICCVLVLGYVSYLVSKETSPYYIIDINDPHYPQGCNSAGLDNPNDYCVLSLYGDNSRVGWGNDNSGTMYVSPAKFETVIDGNSVYDYCNNLGLGKVSREAPLSHYASWSDMVKAKSKIYELTARGSTKPQHYWADIRPEGTLTRNNCTLNGNCGSERSEVPLSVRCIAREEPNFELSFQEKIKALFNKEE